jgi:small subunit ribosomal protein S18
MQKDERRKRRGRERTMKARRDCKICEHEITFSYKRPDELRRYLNKVGKILPRRASRLCAKHQRAMTREVKRARKMALLPFAVAE